MVSKLCQSDEPTQIIRIDVSEVVGQGSGARAVCRVLWTRADDGGERVLGVVVRDGDSHTATWSGSDYGLPDWTIDEAFETFADAAAALAGWDASRSVVVKVEFSDGGEMAEVVVGADMAQALREMGDRRPDLLVFDGLEP